MDSNILSVKKNDFPLIADIFKSGSEVCIKLKLKVFKPEKTERTTNRDMVLTITPIVAIDVIIFMALLELFENKYLLAM